MTFKYKFLCFIVLTFIFIVVGLYVGGAAFFKFSHIEYTYLSYDSLYVFWNEYKHDKEIKPYLQASILLAVFISVLPTLICLAALYGGSKKQSLHGDAKWATDKDLEKSGLIPKVGEKRKYPSILLGKVASGRFKNRYVELVGQTFVGVSAPTGSGKGVAVVIPNLLNYSDSIINSDIKLENFEKTAGFRQSQGQEVYLFAPDGYATSKEDREKGILRSHCWNPYFYIRREAAYKSGDLMMMANSMYPLSGDAKSDVWPQSAGNLFIGLSLWLIDTEKVTKREPTLPNLLALTGVEGGLSNWMKSEIHQEYMSEETVNEFNNFLSYPEETKGSILLTFNSALSIVRDKTVAKALSRNDFDFRDLRRKGITIYYGVQPPNKKRFQGLLNLFSEQFINENTRVTPEIDKTLTHQCLALLDEFPALGRVNQIKESIGFTRQYNLRYLLIYQDKSQLEDKALYNKEGADNIVENFATEIIFPPKKVNQRVKEISETLGTYTYKVKNRTRTKGKGITRGVNESEHKRELLKPAELVELGHVRHKTVDIGLKTLLFKENQRSFVMNKIIYFDEPIFLERVNYSRQNLPIIPLLN